MERSISHIHSRSFAASQLPRIVSTIDALFSDTDLDAFPRDVLPVWRTHADTASGLAAGSRFGSGPLVKFEVTHWDGHGLEAIMALNGFVGKAGFTLQQDGEALMVTHYFEARITTIRMRLYWLLLGAVHDWSMEAILDRMEIFLRTGRMPAETPTRLPGLLRLVPKAVRESIYRMMGPVKSAERGIGSPGSSTN